MTLADPERSRVVLIGTSQFTDPELPDLPAVRNNLDGLAACFRDPARWGLPEEHCVVVPDPDSVVALVDPIHDAAAEAEDTLLIYYAGHGLVHPRTHGLLLAVAGSRPGRTHTAAPYDEVRNNVIDSPAARKVVILDCCYSGRAAGGMADPASAVANEASVEGTYLLTSAPPNKQSLSPPGETYTAFTGALLALLTEGVPDGPELLQLDAIYRHVRNALKRAARPEPQLRTDNTAGELALVRNPWRRTPFPGYFRVDKDEPKRLREHASTLPYPRQQGLDSLPYQLGKVIGGKGKFGVRTATDRRTNRTVVVKRLPAVDGDILRALATFDHPGIVRVLDISKHHVVLEHVDGTLLSEVIQAGEPIQPHWSAKLMAEVCDALDYGHQHGVAHGEVNSRNVMLTRDESPKLLNFGVRAVSGAAAGIRSDINSAGTLLLELLTLMPPRKSRLAPDAFIQPAHIAATAMDPDQGYHSAAEMRDALRSAL